MLLVSWIICIAFLSRDINGQFRPGFTPALNPVWGGRPTRRNNAGQQVAQILNSQPLGLNERQGQQLFNQIAQQVLQSMGSTAQIRNFDSPSGFVGRFNTFSPEQLMSPSDTVMNPNILDNRNDFTDRSALNDQPFMNPQRFPQGLSNRNIPTDQFLQGPQFTRPTPRHLNPGRGDLDIPMPFSNEFNSGISPSSGRTPDTPPFPDAIPIDPSDVHISPDIGDPVARALQINTRLKERLQAVNINDDRLMVSGPESDALEEIKRENRRLRKLLRQTKRQQNNINKPIPVIHKPVPPPVVHKTPPQPPSPQKKNGGFGTGLLLGVLGAMVLG